jgi:uncharacterized protein YqeY
MIDITKKIMDATKAHDKVASETYKLIKAKILEFKTQKNAPEYNDEAEIKLLQKMSKERKDTAKVYSDNGRPELAEKELAEAAIIDELLPKVPTEDDILAYFNAKYPNGVPRKEMGLAIKDIKSALLGVDGSMVANIVKTKLI